MSNSRSRNSRVRRVFAALFFGVSGTAGERGQQQTTTSPTDAHLIRVWGYSGLSGQLLRWESEYRKIHPEIRFENQLHSPATVMAGLYNGVADIALMGREIWPVETMAYRSVFPQPAFVVAHATAAPNGPCHTIPPLILATPTAPFTTLTSCPLAAY